MSRLKVHLVMITPRNLDPHMTRCGRNVLLQNTQYKLAKDDDPEKYTGVTCHYCRWGRTL